jgi:hypothetical protein
MYIIRFFLLVSFTSILSFGATKMEDFRSQLERDLLKYQPQVCAIKVSTYNKAKPLSSLISKAPVSLVQVICDGGVFVENTKLGLVDSDRVQTMAGAAVSKLYGFSLKSCVAETCYYSK